MFTTLVPIRSLCLYIFIVMLTKILTLEFSDLIHAYLLLSEARFKAK